MIKTTLSGSFKPCETLNIVRAPNTEYFITQKFSGAEIALQDPLDLSAPPELWPEQDSWCDIPWQELEQRFCA